MGLSFVSLFDDVDQSGSGCGESEPVPVVAFGTARVSGSGLTPRA